MLYLGQRKDRGRQVIPHEIVDVDLKNMLLKDPFCVFDISPIKSV